MFSLLQNLLLGIAIAMPIGPMIIEAFRRSSNHGFFSGFLVCLGTMISDLFYLAIIFFGLSFFIDSAIVQTLMLFFGCIVMLYLGISAIKDYKKQIKITQKKPSKKNSFFTGILFGFSSPYILVWWIGIFGSMMVSYGDTFTTMLHGFAVLTGILLWEGSVCFLASHSKKFISMKNIQRFSAISGVILIGFGLLVGYQALLSLL